MKKVLRKNSIYSLVQAILNIALIFFTIPIFIRLLGSELYGIFALIMVAGNLNTFTSLGLTNALVKFIAEQGRTDESNIDIWVNLLIMAGLSLPLTFLALFFDKIVLLNILKIPIEYYDASKWLYFWLLWANFLLLIGQTFKSVLDALQKVYITSVQQIIYNIVYWSFIIVALLYGFGLSEIGFAIFISALIWLILTTYSALRIWAKFSIVGIKSNFIKSTKKQLNFGLQIYTGAVIGFFYEPLSKILISNFVGISAVGYYDIALKIKGQLWGIISKIFYPLFPFISGQKETIIIRKYIHDIEQKAFLLIVPVIALTIILMNMFITLWIGENNEIISITTIYLVSFNLLGSATVIPIYQFLMAKNLVQKTIYLQLTNVIFNIVFFILFVEHLKYNAVIVGNITGIMISFLHSLYYQKKYLNSLIFDSYQQLLLIFGAFIFILISGFIAKSISLKSEILSIFLVVLTVFISTIIFYKIFNLIRRDDIIRYLGEGTISKIVCKIF